ncbi:unnamed protein product [Eruca vesicaria subsp. sativa]|uniref:F-box domain-containing protein n=1 Tax=Eruca vesicaria subsp. sativa TaxID=29727 RepID=A0ABC8KG73_ERUVS|nr:unnamed protein product [Eruca vesicaria subsp. sativa]
MNLSTVTSSSASNAEESPQKNKKNELHDHAPFPLLLLPEEISLNCLARVPRRYHPSVSLVSTTLRRLIASPEIYTERSLFRRTEHVLYVALRPYATQTLEWYTLNPKPFRQESTLVPVPTTFPLVPLWGMSMVTVGSEIYVIGGCVDDSYVSSAFVIDCPSYTCRSLPNMKQERGCAAAGIVEGKLYVIGGCSRLSLNWVEAFDLKTQTWETVTWTGLYDDVEVYEKTIRSFVMDEKVYLMDRSNSFVYDPKEGSLESDLLLNKQWSVKSCVVDDKLYSFGAFGQENTIWEFDPVVRVWSLVKGLEDVLPDKCKVSKMVNYGGKIAVLCNLGKLKTEIWYMEIGLERRGGGEVWGKMLWSGLVLDSEDYSTIVRSLAVAF